MIITMPISCFQAVFNSLAAAVGPIREGKKGSEESKVKRRRR